MIREHGPLQVIILSSLLLLLFKCFKLLLSLFCCHYYVSTLFIKMELGVSLVDGFPWHQQHAGCPNPLDKVLPE